MRDYAKVAPSFWTGETGRQLREFGRDELLVALYLITGPNANMIGIYHLPLPLLCHHTTLGVEGASKALARVSEGGFCRYDSPSEGVFVPMMAYHQIGPTLLPKDNRHAGLLRQLEQYRKTPFIREFYRIYGKPYHLPTLRPLQGASKPLRSQEQEQEQEKEQEQEREARKPRAFVKPTVEEVKVYCDERGNHVNPERFVDHYEANGWRVGKSPMRDWQAAVRNWESNGVSGRKNGATGDLLGGLKEFSERGEA